VGPYGLNLLRRDASILLFGTVGLLYIMFLAGLEIDLTEFKKNKNKIIVFGLATFFLPLVTGTLASYYILGFSFLSSVLLASMFSTHTLISYPIASRYGVTRNKAVALTVGGTMITDILALLILAAVAGMTREEVSSSFWIRLSVSSIVFVLIVFFLLPVVVSWFFKKFDDAVSQYIFVLAIVFLSAFMAEAAGLEAIIGAFFSGLVLNRFVPHTSPLMNRIDFVGNALFIPFFLISVGMLVDVSVLVKGWDALKVAGVIVVVAIITKYAAARITQRTFRLLPEEGDMIFGLSTSHAAATLAIILVGYNIIIGESETGEPIRLLNEDVLNGTILLILISCAVSSFVVQKASRQLALRSQDEENKEPEVQQKILISLAYPETVTELVDIGLMLKAKNPFVTIHALHVTSDDGNDDKSKSTGKKMLETAVKHGAATENNIQMIHRYDSNISNGIIYTVKEQNITDLIIGLHRNANSKDFFGATTERIVRRFYETIFIYNPVQPLNTVKRIVVAVTPNAELEPGFGHWFLTLVTLAKEAGTALTVYATQETIAETKDLQRNGEKSVQVTTIPFSSWDDFLIFQSFLKQNDLFAIVTSRKGYVSHNPTLEKLPHYLVNYFKSNSYLLIYPKQVEQGIKMDDVEYTDSTLVETVNEKVLRQPASLLKAFFKKDNK
jgi:Kef-type K+ transport system membrane component KefB